MTDGQMKPWSEVKTTCSKCTKAINDTPFFEVHLREPEGVRVHIWCSGCMLEHRENQLADCTRAMREVSEELRSRMHGNKAGRPDYVVVFRCADLTELAQKLDDARAGKAAT